MYFKIRTEFIAVKLELQQTSKWQEAISGEAYPTDFLEPMTVKVDLRQELWKYVEVSTHAIREWRGTLFKKVSSLWELSI